MKQKKSAFELVSEAFHELLGLEPTPEEIQAYADLREGSYGVVTYSKHKHGQDWHFLRFHDSWKKKTDGRIHIDVGYVDGKYVDEWNVPDTTHLMLDKYEAPNFVKFIKQKRAQETIETVTT